ncbi:MAG: YHS domain-containing (seleno)protein [Bacteroidota bacterium]
MKTQNILIFIATLSFSVSAYSQKCKKPFPEGKHLVNTDEAGNNIAMEGYDMVSFFGGTPLKGNNQFSSSYQGITYQFASESNKQAFDANPIAYLPEYGGFCAVAMFFGKAEELQTYDLYDVVDGKLYFNKNEKAKKMWDKKTAAVIIKKSDQNWNCVVTDLGIEIGQPYKEPESIK